MLFGLDLTPISRIAGRRQAKQQKKDQNHRSEPNDLLESTIRHGKSICYMDDAQMQQWSSQIQKSAAQGYLLSSPRADLLLRLIRFNVFRALMSNTQVLGFTRVEWLQEEAISPFYSSRQFAHTEAHVQLAQLRPTLLQHTVAHHPWIDLLPIPEMRDNILRAGEAYDDGPLCQDLVEFNHGPEDQCGLIVWGDPWDPMNWEISEGFLKKWAWVIRDCEELFKATNYWRAKRSERKLFPDKQST